MASRRSHTCPSAPAGSCSQRYRSLPADVTAVEDELEALLAGTDGQVSTSLPGVGTVRAAAFTAHSLPISRFLAEHLYSAAGLAPAMYPSATTSRRGRGSRQSLAEHRDARMGIA